MKFKILLFWCLGLTIASQAQSVQSPYSINGIGTLSSMSVAQNMAMGGMGVSYANVWHINNQNPALLTANSFSSFQMGVEGDVRSYSNSVITENATSGSLRYLVFSFPVVSGKYSTSIGLTPYSSVNYKIASQQIVPGTSVIADFNYSGRGGLTQAYWAHGVKIVKNLSLGLRASYIFGSVKNEIVTSLSNDDSFQSGYTETASYSDGNFSIGLHYRHKIKDQMYAHFGATYELSTTLNGTRLAILDRRDFSNRISPLDTVINANSAKFALPTHLAVGFTLERLNKFAFGIEYSSQNWSNASGFEDDNTQFNNATRLALGGEYIPDYVNVNSYFKRVTYRMGVSFEQSPYLVNGTQINDLGLSFGWSLPVSRANSLDMAFKLGQNGTLDNNLVRERYFKFTLGATVNDRWFIRRKFD